MPDRPVIGLTLDWDAPGPERPQARYVLRENYCAAVGRAGGLPVLLPHEAAQAEAYVAGLDGLLVTGGNFDLDPALFGAGERHPTVTTKDRRTAFEMAATRAALARDLPVLGICGGMQLLNVALGGTLIHGVALAPGSRLRRICGAETLEVNSAHHQAAKEVPAGVAVSARAPDGVIEGIEAAGYAFCLGVQWHPEYHVSAGDAAIFEAFLAAARS